MTPERYRQIVDLFEEAAEKTPEARTLFLAQACAGDSDLRREVEALLAGTDPHRRATAKNLGPYEILGPLGSGGMGEVYRALDTKLGREVAIKILPEAFARNPERLARLRREARMLAALNHPNIAALYALEEIEGTCFLVLELIPGKTLAETLAPAPLPLREALSAGRQIAEALEAAHEKGIVHRDLKPANVKITPEGRIKLLDFGLAKAGAGPDPGDEPTLTELTGAGAVLGTVSYMSPEQARGLPVDKRSDVWSFGCVLYEMLVGRRLFGGRTPSDILASILREAPNLAGLPEATPPGVRLLLERCLRQDLAQRQRDIGDARLEIEEALATPATVAKQGRSSGRMWALGAALLAIAAVGGWWLGGRRAQAPARNVQFQRITDFVGMEESPAISPDGKTVAFVARAGGTRHVWLRLLAGGAPLQITRDDGDHQQPRWAPDSSSLIYFSASATPGEQGAIWEIPALGGAPRRLAAALGGGDISHDGHRIALFRLQDGNIELITQTREGSAIQVVKKLPDTKTIYYYPRWSPDDRWIAFERQTAHFFDVAVAIIPAAGGELREIARGNDMKRFSWLPDGAGLVYASSSGSTVLYPPTFNLRRIDRDGTGDRQLTFGDVSYVEPDVGASGRLLASRIGSHSDIWKFPVSGSPEENTRGGIRITRQTGLAQTPSVSPDGKEVVFLSDSGGHGNLWVAKTDGSVVRQITFERDPAVSVGVPVWSPAGSQIVFILTKKGTTGQWLVNPDGSGLRQMIPQGVYSYWSGDGRWLYYAMVRNGAFCIEKVAVGGGAPVPIRCDNAVAPAVGPEGSTLYYATSMMAAVGFDYEVRAARPENGPSQLLARVDGWRVPNYPMDFQPILSPDGKSLAVPLTDGVTSNLWTLPAEGGPMRQLTDFGERSLVIARRISWSPDGKYIYAALAEVDADVVLMDGLLP